MIKRVFSLLLCVALALCMVCPFAFADDSNTYDTCTHEWEQPFDHWYGIPVPGTDITFGVDVERCSKCGLYKHTADLLVLKSTYYSPLPPHMDGIIPSELITYWLNVWYNFCGKNATPSKAPTGISRKDLPGYADDNGTPNYSVDGNLQVSVYPQLGASSTSLHDYPATFWFSTPYARWDINGLQVHGKNTNYRVSTDFYYSYNFIAPISGTYLILTKQNYIVHLLNSDNIFESKSIGNGYFNKHLSVESTSVIIAPTSIYLILDESGSDKSDIITYFNPIILTVVPDTPTVNTYNNLKGLLIGDE